MRCAEGSGSRYMNNTDNGIVHIATTDSVDEVVNRLKTILETSGVKLFALIDHSGEAAKVGMELPATKLLIFGNPKAGTPLMVASPSIAIDLPLKILVWQDGEQRVWVSYNAPEYLKVRHGIPDHLMQNIAVIEKLALRAASSS